MNRKSQNILRIVVIGLLAILPALAQSQEVFDEVSLKERGFLSVVQQNALVSRRALITDEAANLPANEWVGAYSLEDGLTSGARLDWAPTKGFMVWWSTCSHGLRDKINFGSVDFRDGVLHVKPELSQVGEKVYPLSGDLIPVKWGNQHFLVPLDRLIAFCYAARNASRSREINEFLLKESDRDKRRFGLPSVPTDYKKYLVGPPILATIIEVKEQSGTFTLNAGRVAGIVPGMKFFAVSPTNVYMLVEVLSVSDSSSEAYVVTSGFRNNSQREVKLRVGRKLTSRAPKDAGEYYPT